MHEDGLAACVRAAQAGSLRDFERLVHQFQDMAVGYSRVLLNDFHLAEDASQDAFVQAYTRLGQLQNTDAFPGWFRQIVLSCCTRYRRRRRDGTVQLEGVVHIADPRPLPDVALASKERAALLKRALASLSEEEKTVLSLHFIREHSSREIAAFLEVSPTTVKNRIHAAQRKLRGRLLTMTRQHMTHEAPSHDEAFARKVLNEVEATCQDGASALVGSLHGLLGATGADDSLAKVNSLLGYSFHFCLFEDAAMTEHHSVIEWEQFFGVLERLGLESRHFEATLRGDCKTDHTPEELGKLKEDTWNAVRVAIDRGHPAIAWQPMTPSQKDEGIGAFEWGLLVGYDEKKQSYTVRHRWRSNKAFTVPYDGFGDTDDCGWYYVMVFGEHTPQGPQATTVAALKDAVAYAEGTHYDKIGCCYPVAAVGFDAYELWQNALTRGVPDPRSVRGNANELKFNRQMASTFLRESADHFDERVAQTLSLSAACYDMEVAALAELRNIARAGQESDGFSAAQVREAVSTVTAAFEAEKLAISHITSALEMV